MCGLGVRATCLQRVTDVTKSSVQGHMLGVEFIRQIKQGGTLGEHYGTKTQQMEYYVDAQQARS